MSDTTRGCKNAQNGHKNVNKVIAPPPLISNIKNRYLDRSWQSYQDDRYDRHKNNNNNNKNI